MKTLEDTGRTARRVFGGEHPLTTSIERNLRIAQAALRARETRTTFEDTVATYEEAARIARRVFGGAHPLVAEMELTLQNARAALRTRETPPPSSPSGNV